MGAGSCLLYHVNALAALRRVAEVFGSEVSSLIVVADGRAAGCRVNLVRAGGVAGAAPGLRQEHGRVHEDRAGRRGA